MTSSDREREHRETSKGRESWWRCVPIVEIHRYYQEGLDVKRLARAMQNIQDRTHLDVNNHRYHCGGSEAGALAREYAALGSEEVA